MGSQRSIMPLSTLFSDELRRWLDDNGVFSWSFDLDGHTIDMECWRKLTGQSLSTCGNEWLQCVHCEDQDRVRAAWETAMFHGQSFNTDMRIHCADGIYRWFNARAAPQRSSEGEVTGWVGVMMELVGLPRLRPSRPSDSVATGGIDSGALPASIVRAARGMINWSAEELSQRSGVSVSTIRRLERDDSPIQARQSSTDRLMRAYMEAGLVFIEIGGVIRGVRWARDVD